MIKILFDHQIFSEQRYGGISRYFANLAKEINKQKGLSAIISVLYTTNYYLEKHFQLFYHPLGRWLLKKPHKRYYWNKKYSKFLLKKLDYDIFHATYYDNYSLAYNQKPMVITIHDMIHENSPEMFTDASSIIAQKKIMMDSAAAIIAISAFTKREILKHYPFYENKITVIYHGLPDDMFNFKKSDPIAEKFILYVGERANYKNFNALVIAISPFLRKEKVIKLVCVGGKKFTAAEKDFLKINQINHLCLQIDATDEELAKHYQNALLFVYPSSQEGFGLPMLEAFRNNCPIACSNQSCLPEIGGDAVLYFDPNDERSILTTIQNIIYDPDLAEQLKIKGREQMTKFTMAECVKNTVEVYKNAMRSANLIYS